MSSPLKCPGQYCKGVIPDENISKTVDGRSQVLCSTCGHKYVEQVSIIPGSTQSISTWQQIAA